MNEGHTRAEGVELEAEVKLKSGVQGLTSYALQRAIDQTTGQERSREVEVKERLVDDEMPEVASAFQSWLDGNR